jgi:hypothetical protein
MLGSERRDHPNHRPPLASVYVETRTLTGCTRTKNSSHRAETLVPDSLKGHRQSSPQMSSYVRAPRHTSRMARNFHVTADASRLGGARRVVLVNDGAECGSGNTATVGWVRYGAGQDRSWRYDLVPDMTNRYHSADICRLNWL